MNKKVYIFLADGFEDIEGLMVVDLLRRAKMDVRTVSITDQREITTSHGVTMLTDTVFGEVDFSDAELLVLPGGQPGTTHLKAFAPLGELLVKTNEEGGRIAAICAAPTVLSGLGLLKERKATSYPSCEPDMNVAEYLTDKVVVDGNITTSRGLGTAIDFALSLIGQLAGEEEAEKIAKGVVYH